MPCSTKFSVTLQTEILSAETLDFLKQIFFSQVISFKGSKSAIFIFPLSPYQWGKKVTPREKILSLKVDPPFWKGFVVQGTKQEVTENVSIHKSYVKTWRCTHLS